MTHDLLPIIISIKKGSIKTLRHLQNYFSKPIINDLQRIIQRNLLII